MARQSTSLKLNGAFEPFDGPEMPSDDLLGLETGSGAAAEVTKPKKK